jgi:hypothetical protein
MLGEWETMHARVMQFRNGHMQTAAMGTSGCCTDHGMTGQKNTTAQK